MSDLVDPTEIETIVGARRHRATHLGRAVSAEETVYILHSQRCLDSGIDLRECPFSRALAREGVNTNVVMPFGWENSQDVTVILSIWDGGLVPIYLCEPGVAPRFNVDLVPSSKQPGTTAPQE